MELKGKVDSGRAESHIESLKKDLVDKAHKEINVFKCADHIKDMLLFGMYDEAVNLANVLYHENNLDPVSESMKDPKSKKITEIRYIIRYFKNKIQKQ